MTSRKERGTRATRTGRPSSWTMQHRTRVGEGTYGEVDGREAGRKGSEEGAIESNWVVLSFLFAFAVGKVGWSSTLCGLFLLVSVLLNFFLSDRSEVLLPVFEPFFGWSLAGLSSLTFFVLAAPGWGVYEVRATEDEMKDKRQMSDSEEGQGVDGKRLQEVTKLERAMDSVEEESCSFCYLTIVLELFPFSVLLFFCSFLSSSSSAVPALSFL